MDENERSSEPTIFMALTETWLESHISDAQIYIKNYVVSRCDRYGRGGGVCLYTHNDIPISEEFKYDDGICQCLITIMPSIKMCFSVIYRPPDAEKFSFDNLIQFLKNNLEPKIDDAYQICLAGDLNFPYIDWNLYSVTSGTGVYMQQSAQQFL